MLRRVNLKLGELLSRGLGGPGMMERMYCNRQFLRHGLEAVWHPVQWCLEKSYGAGRTAAVGSIISA